MNALDEIFAARAGRDVLLQLSILDNHYRRGLGQWEDLRQISGFLGSSQEAKGNGLGGDELT